MSRNIARSAPSPRRWPRWPLGLIGALAIGAIVAAGLAIETRPRVATAPDAATARAARSAGETLRDFVDTGSAQGRIELSLAEINALLASAGRLAPGLAAAARLQPSGVALDLSLGAPYLPGGLWANARLAFVADQDGLRIAAARLGRLPLPPRLVQAAMTRAGDGILGDGLVEMALAGVVGLDADADGVGIDLGFSDASRAALLEKLRSRSAGGATRQPVYVHLWHLNDSGDSGALPRSGALTPYLAHAIDISDRLARRYPDVPEQEYATAALLALALYCGEPALGTAIGVTLNARMRGERNHCEGVTLAGRDDLKRHFTVSAGLYAASNGPATLGIGELKELIDSGEGGSGFSFEDLAADLAGARFAAAFLAAPQAEWPAMAALIGAESDVMPSTADLPHDLDEAAFQAQFGDVDSPRYRAMLAEITRRIDALPFYRALPTR